MHLSITAPGGPRDTCSRVDQDHILSAIEDHCWSRARQEEQKQQRTMKMTKVVQMMDQQFVLDERKGTQQP